MMHLIVSMNMAIDYCNCCSCGYHEEYIHSDDRTASPRSSCGRISIRTRIPGLALAVGRNKDDKIADRGGIIDPLVQFCCRHFFLLKPRLFHFGFSRGGVGGRSAPAS